MEKNSRKGKQGQRNKCRKNVIGLKNLKNDTIRKRGKKVKSIELQKPIVEAEVNSNNKTVTEYTQVHIDQIKVKTVQQK